MTTLAQEFTAATRIMHSSSNELSTLVSGINLNKRKLLVNALYLLAEPYDTKSNVKLGGFRSQLPESTLKSSDTTKQSGCGCQYKSIYFGFLYIFNSINIYERLVVSYCLITTMIKQRKKDIRKM